MRSEEYWRKRSLEDKKRHINLAEKFINRELKRSYSEALKEVQEALNKLYQGFADKEHITLQEARKRMRSVNPKDLDVLLQKAKFYTRQYYGARSVEWIFMVFINFFMMI